MKVVAAVRAFLGRRSVGRQCLATSPTAGAGQDNALAAGTYPSPEADMQHEDLNRVASVQLLDDAGVTLSEHAVRWRGDSFDLQIADAHVLRATSVRYLDAAGAVMLQVPFRAPQDATAGAAEGVHS